MRISRKAKRELFWILLFAACIPLLYALVWGDVGLLELRKYRQELQELQLENLRLREQHRVYLEKIQKLQNDPHEIERIARERYSLARPGDIIVNIGD